MSTPVLSIRLSADERRLLQAAADQGRATISEFVRRHALDAAEIELMDRRRIVISSKDWERVEAFVARPPRGIPAVRKLLATKPVWEK
jgi:uncharacterized protein (DUF1778 family)